MTDHTILWRRLDAPGHESCRCFATGSGWRLEGAAVFAHEGQPCRLDYVVDCDPAWLTVVGSVRGWVGERTIAIEVTADADRRWLLNGAECPAVRGCTDLDLNFSPSTNLLPIRRLGLAVGEEALVRAAWLRFPGFTLEPLEQRYRRLAEDMYRYESLGSGFTADLRVNAAELVTLYPNFFEAEPAGRVG
jgi:hypothetical protein